MICKTPKEFAFHRFHSTSFMSASSPLIQDAIRKAEEQCLNSVYEEHKIAYLQLRYIIQYRGITALNDEQRTYYYQMDYYVDASRKAALDQILAYNPQLAMQSDANVDLNSYDYPNQLRMYVQDLIQLPMHTLDSKLRSLYQNMLAKHYNRTYILQHIHNILTHLESYNYNPEKSHYIGKLWEQFYYLPNETEEEEGETMNGYYIRPTPYVTPDDVITYMLLPVKAQQLLNSRTRAGEMIPFAIFIKRRKGRPSKDTGVNHEYFTPVYKNGQIDHEVMQYFYSDSTYLANDVEQLAKKIYDYRDFYNRPENRNQMQTPYPQMSHVGPQLQSMQMPNIGMQPMMQPMQYYNQMPGYGQYNVSSAQYMYGIYPQPIYGQYYGYAAPANVYYMQQQYAQSFVPGATDYNQYNNYGATAAYPEDSSTYDDDATVIATESDEFVEEEATEESSDGQAYQQIAPSDSSTSTTSSSSNSQVSAQDSAFLPSPELSEEEIEEAEIFIEKVVDCKEIPITDAWKYAPSIMIVPRPLNCNKFDNFIPEDIKAIPRSDAGSILDRLDYLEEDVQEMPPPMQPVSYSISTVMVYLVKWRDYAYCHATWEVEDYLTHLASFSKVQAFKNDYKEKKLILQSDKLTAEEKEQLIDQDEERIHNYHYYCQPERIIAYEVRDRQAKELNERLYVLFQTMRDKQFMSDASVGAVTSDYDKLYFNNYYTKPQVDSRGYVVDYNAPYVTSIKGFFYLIKWKNLPYAQATWEMHEDLAMMFSEELLRALTKQFSKRSLPIKRMLSTTYLRFNERPIFKEFTSEHPDFLLDVNREFILKPHYIRGVNVLLYNYCQHKNVILADYLGLGKTIQAVVFLSALYHYFLVPGPFLIVAPLTTVQNWVQTINDWFPDCNLITLVGSKKDRQVVLENELVYVVNGNIYNKFHILLTTPSIALIEELELKKFKYRALILDEAHLIKNERSRTNRLLTSFTTDCKLLITGTPIQNNLSELYTLLHFIDAEVFKNQQEFEKLGTIEDFKDGLNKIVVKNESAEYELLNSTRMKDVEKINKKDIFHADDDEELDFPMNVKPSNLADTFVPNSVQPDIIDKIEYIAQLLKPYILRRVTSVVENSLPEKKEIVLRIPLTSEYQRYSKAIIEHNVNYLVSNESIRLQNVLMQLKKVANHPYVLRDNEIVSMSMETIIGYSAKFQVLDRLLGYLYQQGHRVLIFTQLKKTIEILERYCQLKQYGYEKIIGDTILDERIEAINKFNSKLSKDFIFLLTTKLAQGINLQTADTVVIFDVDWNPQNDLYCIGRAHRIGQMKPVTIYRFLAIGSVEEKIYQVAQRKMILDYTLVYTQNQGIEQDQGILRNVLKYGIDALDTRPQVMDYESIMAMAEDMQNGPSAQYSYNFRDIYFYDLREENDYIFYTLISQPEEPQFLVETAENMQREELLCLIRAYANYGLPKFAGLIKEQTGLQYTPSYIHTTLEQLLLDAREHFRFSRLDIFNLPFEAPEIKFTFKGVECDAVKVLKAFYNMFIIDLHVKNALFKIPRYLFQEFYPARIWNGQYDTILLLDCKKHGFSNIDVQKFSDLAKMPLTSSQLQQRTQFLIYQLQKMPCSKLYEYVHYDGLDTKLNFDTNISQSDGPTETKENEILKKLKIGEFLRTTFVIPHEKHIFTSALQSVMRFFTVERKRKISSIISRFEEFSRSKFVLKEFIGISVMNGNYRLHKKLLSFLERFPLSKPEEDLLFKLYHCIMDIVVTRILDIVQLTDEKISDMKEKNQAINEIDNDSFIMKEISELLDYLYRNVWVNCEIRHIGAPYVLAKMAEWYSESFDEDLLEFGEQDNGGWFCILKLSNEGGQGDGGGLDAAEDDADYPY